MTLDWESEKYIRLIAEKFASLEVIELQNTRDEEDLLLIRIKMKKTSIYLNIIYSLPRHVCQWFRYNYYQIYKSNRFCLQSY